MQEGGTLNVLQALSLANGTTVTISGGTIHVLRPNNDGSVVDIPLSSKRLFGGETAPVVLQAKDVVYVPTSKFKMFMSNSTALLAATASASIYRF